MDVLRTPDERFGDLTDWPYEPRYTEVSDGTGPVVRMHHVDEGTGPVVLLMHGEPSWSYLYRTMIPPLVASGHRVVAPDLVGFGRSDKPAAPTDYSYARHVAWTSDWLSANDLTGITLFCQDWGGLIGLRLVAAHPDRFDRVVVANTGLPTGDHGTTEAFRRWQEFAARVEEFPVSPMIQSSTVTELPPAVLAAYDAPFPEERFKAGARVFPALVPTSPDDPEAPANRRAWEVLRSWQKPFLTAFSDSDPITRGGERPFQKLVPGAAGQDHLVVEDAGHFLQEDKGPELATVIERFVQG